MLTVSERENMSAEFDKADDTTMPVSQVSAEMDLGGRGADDTVMNSSGGSADSGLNDSGTSLESSDRATITTSDEETRLKEEEDMVDGRQLDFDCDDHGDRSPPYEKKGECVCVCVSVSV